MPLNKYLFFRLNDGIKVVNRPTIAVEGASFMFAHLGKDYRVVVKDRIAIIELIY
jgi:hypothetical protein